MGRSIKAPIKPAALRYQGYEAITHQGDAGWGIAQREPRFRVFGPRWIDLHDDHGQKIGRIMKMEMVLR